MFSRGAFGCLALKAKHRQHFPMCSFACTAIQGQKNLSSMHSRSKWPTLSWYPLRATSLCAAGRTNWRRIPSDSLGLAHWYRIPFFNTRLFCSLLYWLNSGESVILDQSCSSVPSPSLTIIILKTGSASGLLALLGQWPPLWRQLTSL